MKYLKVQLEDLYPRKQFEAYENAYKKYSHTISQIRDYPCLECFDEDPFKWAYMAILSRSYEIRRKKYLELFPEATAHDHEEGLAMYPFLDLANAGVYPDSTPVSGTYITKAEPRRFGLRAQRRFATGE